MRFFLNVLVLVLALGAVTASGCDPAQLQDPAAQTAQAAPAGVQQLGPATQAPQIAFGQALKRPATTGSAETQGPARNYNSGKAK